MTRTSTRPRTGDLRDPEARLRALFDQGTLRLLAPRGDGGVLAGRGAVDGTPVIAFATDATRMGGAMGDEGCRLVVDAIDAAIRERVPVIGVWHSGGARLAEGVLALDAVGQVFAATVRASGRVPQLSVVLGPAAGGAAYAPALTDIVIMSDAGRIFHRPRAGAQRHRRARRHGPPRRSRAARPPLRRRARHHPRRRGGPRRGP
jgi:acetyl-CoA/propionyl-CoA carboxylase carboxyl transferase subunit